MQPPENQSERPFLSIITISRNAEKLIGATLQNVADQQGVEGLIEHWVVDGASTDGTLDVVRQFPHVRYISEPDQGIGDAFNKGMHLAQGDYLLYLNCDDILCDNRVLADLYHFAQARKMPDWIIGRWFVRREDGSVVRIKHKYPLTCWSLSLESRICHQAVFLKRELQLQMGGFNLDYRTSMDYDLWARLCLHGTCITNFERPVVIYAAGGFSGQNKELMFQEQNEIVQQLRNTPLKRWIGKLYDQIKPQRV